MCAHLFDSFIYLLMTTANTTTRQCPDGKQLPHTGTVCFLKELEKLFEFQTVRNTQRFRPGFAGKSPLDISAIKSF